MPRKHLTARERETLLQFLPLESRVDFADVALQESAAVMNYSLQKCSEPTYRAWMSLTREERIQCVPEDPLQLLAACKEPAWAARSLAYGAHEIKAVRACKEGLACNTLEPSPSQLSVLRMCLSTMPDAEWLTAAQENQMYQVSTACVTEDGIDGAPASQGSTPWGEATKVHQVHQAGKQAHSAPKSLSAPRV